MIYMKVEIGGYIMKKTAFGVFLVAISIMVFQQTAFPEIYCKIKGRVIDAETREGIPDVFINAHLNRHDNPKEYYVFSDEKGYFTFSNLLPGLYKLNFNPLFPYVAFPDNDYFRSREDDFFRINKGEIKEVFQELLIGGEIILNYNLANGNFSEYELENFYLDRIEGNKLIYNIESVSSRFDNPRFKSSKNGYRISGLAPGEYIICRSLRKRPENYSGDDVDYAGVIKRFSLEKLESKELDLDYNSTSKISFDIKDKNGYIFQSGYIKLYKTVNLDNEESYYKIWSCKYDYKNFLMKPIVIEPGNYLLDVKPWIMSGENGNEIDYYFVSNYIKINVSPNESKILNILVSIQGKELDGSEYSKFKHY
jgi:hypothetical protein